MHNLIFGTDDLTTLDAGAFFLLSELKAANYGARAGQTIAGNLGRDANGHWVRVGADGKPLAKPSSPPAASAQQSTRQGKGGKGKKPAKTPEDRQSEREQQHATNRTQVLSTFNIGADGQAALEQLRAGRQPDSATVAAYGLEGSGLVTKDSEGQYRLSPQGRALLTAADQGDAGRARDAISLGKDRATAAAQRTARAQERLAARQKKQAAAEEQRKQREKEQAARAGGGGGSHHESSPSPPPTAQPEDTAARDQHRQQVRDTMAAQDAGLSPSGLAAFTAFLDGGQANPDLLAALANDIGVLDQAGGEYVVNAQGRALAQALDSGDAAAALNAIQTAVRQRQATHAPGKDRTMGKTLAEKSFFREGDDVHPGAMIALLLDDATRMQLLDAAELNESDGIADHCTLIFLTPKADDLDAQKNQLVARLADLAAGTAPITGVVNGYGRFVGDGEDGDALYANVDCPTLAAVRQRLIACVESCGVAFVANHGFTPHTTLVYLEMGDPTPDLDIPKLPLAFDRIALVWAGETLTFPLQGAPADALPAVLQQALGATADGMPLALDDTLIAAGETVKSYGNGHIGGYLVRFGNPNKTDLVGDYFTPETDFGITPGMKTAVYFNHRLPLKTRNGRDIVLKEQIGEGTLGVDRHGVFIDAVLYNREQYKQMLHQLDWSSGTAAHLVDRVPMGKATWLKKWPLGLDASLTPTPCDPDARGQVYKAIPLKSYIAPELALEADPEATGTLVAAVSAARKGASSITRSTKETLRMEPDELKALFAEAFKTFGGDMETKFKAMNEAVDVRLKAFEDSPALKNSGHISMDGGSADKHVKSFADWLLAVKRRDVKRLSVVYKSHMTSFGEDGLEVKDLNEGSGPAGGYLVPVEYEPELQRISAEAAIVEPRARKFTMNSASKMVPMLKQTANPSTAQGGSAFFGGLVFYWNPEAANLATDKSEPAWEMIELIARKLTGLTVSSNELTEDAPALQSELTQLFGEGLAHAKDFFYLRGDGVGKPLGVLNAPCAYSLTRKSSGNNVEIEDVSGMMARMLPGGFKDAVWVSHPLNISDLIQMKIGDTPVFQPDARGPVAGTLLGRPIAFSEYSPAPGSLGDLMLCNFQAYGVGIRRGIAIASSEHVRFDTDQTTWKITYRGDGQPLMDSTVKLADGANTQVAPFVLLN